jgi:Cell wall-active antibiotics response LiaF, C-terminal
VLVREALEELETAKSAAGARLAFTGALCAFADESARGELWPSRLSSRTAHFQAVQEATMDCRAEDTLPVPISTDEDSFERGAALGDLNIRVWSRKFRGGRLTAVMSGVTVDLRDAALSPDGATISVQSALSDIEIIVPREWDVVCDIDGVCGAIESQRFPPPSSERGPRLRLTGMVVAGGLCVR